MKKNKSIQHENTLTRSIIKSVFQKKLMISVDESSVLLESIIQEINLAIVSEKYLKIFSFGTFLIHEKKERLGRNPKTKEEAIISPRKSVSFRASESLKELVNTPEVGGEMVSES